MASIADRGLGSAALTIARIGIVLTFAAAIAKGDMVDLKMALGAAMIYVIITQLIVVIRIYEEAHDYNRDLGDVQRQLKYAQAQIAAHERREAAQPVVEEDDEEEEEELDPTITDEHNQRIQDLEYDMAQIREALLDAANSGPEMEMSLRVFCGDLLQRFDRDEQETEADSRTEG